MSEVESTPPLLSDNSDPAMQAAYESARANFCFFWREVARERQRIVPALGLACVKAPFTDGVQRADGAPDTEHMWLSEVDFDGKFVSGVLGNSPHWLTSVRAGDSVQVPVGQISDWMYSIDGEAYGGYTVHLLRSRMTAQERDAHDAAWDLNFGPSFNPRMVAEREHQALNEASAASLRAHLAEHSSAISARGGNGWTLLHQEASAGSMPTVVVLLEAGADPHALSDQGLTALELAKSLGWEEVAEVLASAR